jgi:hypothetical protein
MMLSVSPLTSSNLSHLLKTVPYPSILHPSYVEIVHAGFLLPSFPSDSRLFCFFNLLCVTLKRFHEVGGV